MPSKLRYSISRGPDSGIDRSICLSVRYCKTLEYILTESHLFSNITQILSQYLDLWEQGWFNWIIYEFFSCFSYFCMRYLHIFLHIPLYSNFDLCSGISHLRKEHTPRTKFTFPFEFCKNGVGEQVWPDPKKLWHFVTQNFAILVGRR